MIDRIRCATAADSAQLFELAGSFATSFRPEIGAFTRSFERLIAEDDVLLLVVADSDRLLGYLLGFDHDTLFANGRVAWIEELMVREDCRRHGHGKRLVARFEDWARSRGSKLVALATRRAAHFYQALGYAESAAYFRKLL